MNDKQLVINTLTRLPDNSSFTKIKEEFEILAALHEAEEDIENHKVKTHEEVNDIFSSWFSK